VGAALAFTKVNVGVFYAAGLAHALVCLLPSGRIRSIGIGLTLTYAAVFPWLLMHGSFHRGFGGYFILATAGGVATFACGALARPQDRLPMRAALCSGAGLLAGTGLMVAATSLDGVPVRALVLGVILNPLHQSNFFCIPLDVGRIGLLAAMVLTGAVAVTLSKGRRLEASRWLDALRCVVGIGSIALALCHQIQWVVPLLPLALIPPSHCERDPVTLFSRLFVTFMAVTQFLEPYPIAGSQVGIAAAPMILWAFLCIADGIAGLRASWRLDAAIGGAILVVAAGVSIAVSAHSQFPPASTRLKGSTWLHLPAEQTARFESIVRDVGTNCGILFTMPGMGSFNIWSGVPTPNRWNLTVWMQGVGPEEQAEILSLMQSDSRSCAILNRRILRFWGEDEAGVAALPLARYVMTEMPEVAEFGDYEIRVHPRRSAPWVE
jgi:hypothetical protein